MLMIVIRKGYHGLDSMLLLSIIDNTDYAPWEPMELTMVNSLKLGQNDRYSADAIFSTFSWTKIGVFWTDVNQCAWRYIAV